MARCSGCTSVFHTDSTCITLTGNGSSGDPLVATLTCTSGGVPDNHIVVPIADAQEVLNGVPLVLVLDNTVSGFEQRGTNVTWNIANPTRITCSSTGVYDIGAVLAFFAPTGPGAFEFSLLVNGVSFAPASIMRHLTSTVSNTYTVDVNFNGLALVSTNYVEIAASYADGGGVDSVFTFFGGINVTQRI